jgi:hypothetical protein
MTLTVPLSYSYNGLTFGGIGQDVQVLSATGVRGTTQQREGDTPWPQRDGNAASVSTMDERIMQFALQVMNPAASFASVMALLANTFVPIDDPNQLLPLQCFMDSTWTEARQTIVRVANYDPPLDMDYSVFWAKPLLKLTAPDPLWYSSTLHGQTVGLPSPTAGLTFNVSFDVPFGASSGGSMTVTNAGNYKTAPLITITGPCTNPSVTLGSAMVFLNLTLGVSDVVVIDMAARTVTLNGVARQNSPKQGSSWWTIPVGTSTISVASQDSAAVAAQFTVQWRDAWSAI